MLTSDQLSVLNSKRILLASASVNRQEILKKCGITNFVVSASNFAEDLPKESFATSMDYVTKTCECKMLDKLAELAKMDGQPADSVICADTIISFDNTVVVEKPLDDDHAFAMLREICDRKHHEVYTSVWVAILDFQTQKP